MTPPNKLSTKPSRYKLGRGLGKEESKPKCQRSVTQQGDTKVNGRRSNLEKIKPSSAIIKQLRVWVKASCKWQVWMACVADKVREEVEAPGGWRMSSRLRTSVQALLSKSPGVQDVCTEFASRFPLACTLTALTSTSDLCWLTWTFSHVSHMLAVLADTHVVVIAH